MKNLIIRTNKKSLDERVKRTENPKKIKRFLMDFLNEVNDDIQINDQVYFDTHKDGVTGKYMRFKNAFLHVNVIRKGFSIHCWTGDEEIKDLPKANWSKGNDKKGSIWYPVELNNQDRFNKAVEFACKAFKIKANLPNVL